MQRRFNVPLFGACLMLGMLIICVATVNQPAQIYPATTYYLSREQTVALQLPAGDYAGQAGTDAIFMSTVWLNGRLPTEMVAFS